MMMIMKRMMITTMIVAAVAVAVMADVGSALWTVMKCAV
jgi:hypothetical protein